MPPTERVFIIHSELAFLSGLVYFIETIIVIQLPSMLVLPVRQNQRYGGIPFFPAAELYRITGAGGPCGENHDTIHAQIPK